MAESNKTVRLETERLILRKLTTKDAREMFENWASDTTVTKYLSWNAHKNVEETKKFLKENEQAYESEMHFLNWGIVLKSTGQLIGSVSATPDKNDVPIFGWAIGHQWWGRGYVPEAASVILHYLFKELDMKEVKACHIVENEKSGRVMQKIGMQFVEECMDTHQGKTALKCWYKIRRQDFIGSRNDQ